MSARPSRRHLPSLRQSALVLAGGGLIAAVCWAFGVNVWHAISLGAAITVAALAGAAANATPDETEVTWRPWTSSQVAGSRRDVSSLSASLRAGWGRVGHTAEIRAGQIARRRLAAEGLDLSNPEHRGAIEARIGAGTYAILLNRGGRNLSLSALLACLDQLDALDPSFYPAPTTQPRGWRTMLVPFRRKELS